MQLSPAAAISDPEREHGLRLVAREAFLANASGALTSGVIMTALALHLNASNTLVGVLAAAPFITQVLQLPGVVLIERVRERKRIAVLAALWGRSMLVLMAVLAMVPAWWGALPALVLAQFLLCGLGAIGGCAWNAWLRDLVPQARFGEVLGRRTTFATISGLAASIAAGFALDWAQRQGGPASGWAFAALYGLGFVASLGSARMTAAIPEPAMAPAAHAISLRKTFAQPLRDRNFRRLLIFLGAWNFAVNLSTPFLAVYFLQRIGLSVAEVVILSAISQGANVLALTRWGPLSDRFSNKTVLAIAAPALLASIAGMAFASQWRGHAAAFVYLAFLHAVMGAFLGGATLASANIVLKLAPAGASPSYIAASAVTNAASAGLAPLLGGAFADFFAVRGLSIEVRWTDPHGVLEVGGVHFANWEFYFIAAAFLGLYALHRLALVREEGEIEPRALRERIFLQWRKTVRSMSSISGLKGLTDIPGSLLDDEPSSDQDRAVR